MSSEPSTSGTMQIKRTLTDVELENILYESDSDYSDIDSEQEENHDSFSEHDSESVIDEESDAESVDNQQNTNYNDYYIGKDGCTKWFKRPPPTTRTLAHNIVSHLPGCKSDAKNVKDVAAAFALFFDSEILELIVKNTNIYITLKVKPKFERPRDSKLLTITELKAFLGILIISGVLRSSHLKYKDLFSTDDLGNDFFYTTMCYKRFLFILRALRFDDVRSRIDRAKTDKMAAVRELFEKVNLKFQKFFTSGEYVTIDEQLVAFRGNCNFRQYIPSKPNTYGIKIFALVDATNFYCCNLEVYLGKQPEGPYQLSNSALDVVLRLIRPISKTGRNLTVDNWFTSIPLAEKLLNEHKITLVGTVRKNKREIPGQFLPNKVRDPKSTLFGFTKNATMMSYVPQKSKAVILLSTLHNDNKIDETTGDNKKPEILTFYNLTKGGVDTLDKLCATYNVGRRSRRWPMAIFFHMVNVCAVNALIIYNSNNMESTMTRRAFLKALGRELARPYQMERACDPHIPRKIRNRLTNYLSIEPVEEEVPQIPERKRCYACPRSKNRHTRVICNICRRHICRQHTRNLCNECFNDR